MLHDHVLKKLNFDPIPRVQGVRGQNICNHVAAFVILFNLISNMTMYWKKTDFLPTDPIHRVGGVGGGGGGGGLRAKYLLPRCCIRDSL